MTEKGTIFHEPVLRRLKALEEKGLLAHAYLFVGMKGVGKSSTALQFAKFLNCEVKKKDTFFCNDCPSCIKVNALTHPDVHVIEHDKPESISIEKIRDMISQTQLKPFISSRKVFIIKDAELLTLEAANALLKTLEEPPDKSLLILTTSAAEKNLETIRSRCQTIHFAPSGPDEVQKILIKENVPSDAAHFLSFFAHGSLGQARQLQHAGIFDKKNDVIERFLLKDDSEALLKEVLSSKEETKLFLDVLLSWVRDCCLLKSGVKKENLIHADRLKDLKDFESRMSLDELTQISAEVIKTYGLLAENFNLKVPLIIIKELIWARSLK